MDRGDDGVAPIPTDRPRGDGQPISAVPGCVLLVIGLLLVLLLAAGWML